MNKLRSDSVWAALTPEQRQTLEDWLFEENLSYAETLERAQKEFGITSTIPSLLRFYRRLAAERNTSVRKEAATWLKSNPAKDSEPEAAEEAAFKILGVKAYEMALEGPGKVDFKEFRQMMNLLLEHRLQLLREDRLLFASGCENRESFRKDIAQHMELHRFVVSESPITREICESILQIFRIYRDDEPVKKEEGSCTPTNQAAEKEATTGTEENDALRQAA